MIESFLIMAILVFGCGFILKKVAENQMKRFNIVADAWNRDINEFMDLYDIKPADVEFMYPQDIDNKLQNAPKDVITFVGDEINKGYDFMLCEPEKGFIYKTHLHKKSCEFFYILNGTIRMATENGSHLQTLQRGDCTHVSNETYHSIEALEDSEFICIAKPELMG